MPPTLTSTIAVCNLESAEKYLALFEVECWNSARTTLIAGPLTMEGEWDSAASRWKQKNPLYFRGLVRGTTYSFRSRVIPQGGGPASAWSAWADETAGDITAPAPTYSPTGGQDIGRVTIAANPSGAPSDIDRYEFYWNLTGTAPSSTTLPNAPSSADGTLSLTTNAGEAISVWIRAVDTSGNRQAWTSLGTFSETGVSTVLNTQASTIPATVTNGPFSYTSADDSGAAGSSHISWTWVATTIYRSDNSSVAVAASSSNPVPGSPSLSQVAGGSKGARTSFVRIALMKDGLLRGISAEASLAISANNLTKVTSPASQAGMDGWVVLYGTSTGNLFVQQSSPIAFGTDWTEPTGAVKTTGSRFTNFPDVKAAIAFDLTASRGFRFYPYYKFSNSVIGFEGGANGSGTGTPPSTDPSKSRVPLLDGNYALAASSGMTATTPASSGSGGGGGGGGNGVGCVEFVEGEVPAVALAGGFACRLVECEEFWEAELADGSVWRATPDHRVYTDKGKVRFDQVRPGDWAVMRGNVAVEVTRSEKSAVRGRKAIVTMPACHLFWWMRNGRGWLSHNVKPI